MKKIFILAIILLSGTATASAQEFLTINPDVRTAGMANASVATTGGAYSVFQNAASSLFSHNLFEVGFSYSPWMRDVKKGYDLMAFGGFYSFNHKHSISFGTRFYREPKLSPDDEDYPFIPKDENNNPIVGIEAFRPLSVSADLAYSYRIGRYLGLSVTARYIRSEYSGMLQSQLTKGNNGLIKKKYITFGIEADSLRTAKPKLERIETDILNNFKTLGVRTEPLSGYERLKVLHDVFNMDTNEPFRFSFDMVARTGLSTKDFIAPTSFDFREGKCFKMGRTIGAVSFLQILAPELNDRMLADFLEMDSNITVNFHIRTIDQAKAIKSIKMKITDLDKMKIEEVRPDRALCSVA